MQRNKGELPGLMQFRRICIAAAVISAAASLLFVAVRFPPSLRSFAVHGSLVAGLLAGHFSLIGLRTHVICSQIRRGTDQLFDRAEPEWITVLFSLAIVASLFWPL